MEGYRYFLATLTGLSCGRTHHVPKSWIRDTPGPWHEDGCAACSSSRGKKSWHDPVQDHGEARLSVSLDSYDYDGQTQRNSGMETRGHSWIQVTTGHVGFGKEAAGREA